MIKVLLVDDERLARAELRRLLAAHTDIAVVGEAANGAAARAAVEELRPDLLFLDISMPDEDGFTVLESLGPPVPRVIFVTAHDEHAVRAFRANALDYLMKPVDPAVLADALARARTTFNSGATPAGTTTGQQFMDAADQVFVREGDNCLFVSIGEIRLLRTDGNYTQVMLKDRSFMLHRSLSALEQRLPPHIFFRANRGEILNLHHVRAITPWFSGNLKATLDSKHEVELSRRQSQLLRQTREL